MILILRKIILFIERDIVETISYRLTFIMQFISIFIHMIVWYFIAKLFGHTVTPQLKGIGGDYFSFVLVGIAFTRFFDAGLNVFSAKIGEAQIKGTLEAMLVTSTSASSILIFSSLWAFFYALIHILVYFISGTLFFNANLLNGNFILVIFVFLLSGLSLSGIGIIAAAFMIIFKRSLYLPTIMSYLFQIFSGVYFPVSTLPTWLANVSFALPITYSLRAVRGLALQGLSLREVSFDIIILITFTLILLPLGLLFFEYAIKKAKKNGSLGAF